MDRAPRRGMAELRKADIPTSAGVYALYRDGDRMYVGKAGSLRERVWKSHSRRGTAMGNSAMRRNVAEHLEIATAADIKAERYRPTAEDAAAIRGWLDGCEIAWRECTTEPDAVRLETSMKAECLPPLTKR